MRKHLIDEPGRTGSLPGLILLLSLGGLTACQSRAGEDAAAQAPPVTASVEASPLVSLRRADRTGTMSSSSGQRRVLRYRGRAVLPASSSEASELLRALVVEHGEALGMRDAVTFLPVRRDELASTVVHRFQRLEQGLPVVGGELIAGVEASGDLTFLRHAYPATLPPLAAKPLGERRAIQVAGEGLLSLYQATVDARVWVEGDREHRGWHEAYRVVLRGAKGAPPLSAWIFVEVGSGEVVRRIDRLAWAGSPCVSCDATLEADCGRIFFHTPPEALDDPSIQNSSNVDAAMVDCRLTNLSSASLLDGRWANTGPTANSGSRIAPPYDALRSADQRAVDEVNAYFHADRAKRYLEALGSPGVMAYSIGIDAHDDQVGDNAYYDPQVREMHFGEGGVDDAQDADVVYHEYGHAIQDDMVPGWGASYEAGALGEGFGDYFAAGITDDSFATVLGPACSAAWDAVSIYPYDGSPGTGCLRRLDGNKRFPEDQVFEVHADGEFWSAPLWALRSAVGPTVADPIVLHSHTFLSSATEYIDAADALLAADQALNAGANAAAIHTAMFGRGIPRSASSPDTSGMTYSAAYACETAHDYQARDYVECTFTQPGADKIRFHFSRLDTEEDYDFVRISDGTYNEVEILSGNLFDGGSGYSAPVAGDTIVARFFADPGVETWGFAIDGVSYSQAGCAVDADCDDGLFCTGTEACSTSGLCVNTPLAGLDDGVPCTIDQCDENAQTVAHVPDDGVCSDDRFCNGTETCHPTLGCQLGAPPVVDDGIACTQDVCVERNDTVVNLPVDENCDDGLYCNGVEVCDGTLGCQPGTPVDIDDGVSCTVDSCDDAARFVDHVVDDSLCDDGLFCNGVEYCDRREDCRTRSIPPVDDRIPCTVDSCDEENDQIVNLPDDTVCSDDTFCNGAEICDPDLGCQAGEAPVVDDENACTLDACDEDADQVTHAADPECADPITGERTKGCGCSGGGSGSGGLGLGLLLLGGVLVSRRRS